MALPDYQAAQFGRKRRARLGVAIFILLWLAGLLGAVSAHASSLQAKLDQAREYYDKAREVHASLVLTPPEKRTQKDYASLIEDFRRVYLTAPTYGNDTVCLMMVGDLSEEAARRFNQPRYFQDAIDSYEFLLKEYPGSQFRFEALHSIARVYQQDLGQPAKALEQYKRYLKMFPGSAQARQVEVEVARLQDQLGDSSSKTAEIAAEKTGGRPSLQASVQAPAQAPAPTPSSTPASAPSSAQAPARTPIQTVQASSQSPGQSPGQSPEPPAAASSAKSDNKSGKKVEAAAAAPAVGTDLGLSVTASGSSEATISGVRFWKTADDSRVVLETGQKVKYEVGRATSPDRLYLDLYDTKVTPASGKTVSVDDGLLKNIRLGQYKPGVSRVVLDLSDKTEFVISELTNPYRLVIDVHPAAQGATAALAGPDAKGAAAKQDATRQISSATPAPTPSTVSAAGATTNSAATTPGAPLAAKQAPASGSATRSAASFGTPDAKTVATKEPDKSLSAPDRSPAKTPVAAKPEPVQIAKATLPSTSPAAAFPAASADRPSADKQSADKAPIERATVDKSPADRSSDKSVDKIKAADPISGSGQTLTRALGLKIGRILIDPGHGGHDTGTIGPSGYTEKELVLDVSQRLGKLIEDRLGSEVDFTREDDNFVPLEERAEMANKMQADLFISIHANSSHARTASGIETYYLSLTADPEALEVAARENAVSQETISELQGLVRKIALNEKVDESKEFATRVQAALSKNLAKGKTQRFDRGVKKAPFVVLIGANMPAILAEISFLSNPEEEKRLKTPEQRQKIAEALYAGVSGYAGTLSGVKNVHSVHEDKPLETSQPAQPAPARSDKSQPTQTASLD